MKLISLVMVVLILILALVAAFQVTLVQDLVTASGYSSQEVFSGFAALILIFASLIFALDFRR